VDIVQVMLSTGEGGLEKHFVDLCTGAGLREKLADGVLLEPLDARQGRRNPLLRLRVRDRLRRHRPDIVHAQANKASVVVAALGTRTPWRRVATVHNLKRRLDFAGRFDLVIGVSRAVCAQLDHPRIRTIYNGVERPPPLDAGVRERLRAELLERAETRRGPLWVAVGRLVRAKGFDVLLEAFTRVQGALFIAGEGPERERLLAGIDALGLARRVFLLGHRGDVPALMQAADAVAIASRREGFSYVFAEALLAGKPVVATDVPIANELLPAGLVVPVENPGALAAAMNGLELDAACWKELTALAGQRLTVAAMVEATERAYRTVLEQSS